MTARAIDVSLVVPVHDEMDNLEPLVVELEQVLGASALSYEIVLVDDGSRDGSAEEIARLAVTRPALVPVRFRSGRGQTAALDAGFKATRGRFVVTLDADLQNDPRDIFSLLAALDADGPADAAIGYRVRREDPWSRRVASRIANAIRNHVSDDDIIDTGCSLKAFRREAVGRVKLYDGLHRFLPTLLRHEGCRVVQVPVNHRPRRLGRSKYGLFDRAPRALVDLLVVRWMKRRRLDYEVLRDEP